MPVRRCDRCQKTFTRKSNYDTHINRKVKCDIVDEKSDNILFDTELQNDNKNKKKSIMKTIEYIDIPIENIVSQRRTESQNARLLNDKKSIKRGKIAPETKQNFESVRIQAKKTESILNPLDSRLDQATKIESILNPMDSRLDLRLDQASKNESILNPMDSRLDQAKKIESILNPLDSLIKGDRVDSFAESIADTNSESIAESFAELHNWSNEGSNDETIDETIDEAINGTNDGTNVGLNELDNKLMKLKAVEKYNYESNNKLIILSIEKEYKCQNCYKKFSTNSNLCKHISKNSCKPKEHDDLISLKREFEQYKKENQERQIENEKVVNRLKQEIICLKESPIVSGQMTNIDQSVGKTVNTINNIVVLNYGSEDMSKIDREKILQCVKQGFRSAVRLTDAVHFDPDKPENHNVYISNLKNKYAMIFRNGSWEAITKTELIDKIYNDKKNYIENNIEQFYESMSLSQKNALQRWLHTDDDHPKIGKIKEEIRLLLFNKKEIVNKKSL